MTNGLDVLLGWLIFLILLAVLGYIILRRTSDDPFDELRRTQSHAPPPSNRPDDN